MNICVLGVSASGKSTLAKHLADILGLTHIELDSLHFLPGWIERPDEDMKKDVLELTERGNWVVCGNYAFLREYHLDNADKIIWLNYPFYKVFWRCICRTLRRIINKEPCCNGNIETIRMQFFSKYSIFWWVIRTFWRRRKTYTQLSQDPRYREKFMIIHNEEELQNLLKNLP
ncbi:MAG: adenylate kinase [Alphaproteobacteria bacterium]